LRLEVHSRAASGEVIFKERAMQAVSADGGVKSRAEDADGDFPPGRRIPTVNQDRDGADVGARGIGWTDGTEVMGKKDGRGCRLELHEATMRVR
jgi:hypothetical protein